MRKLTLALGVLLTFMVTGCSITLPMNATGNAVGSKVGTATAKIILGFYFDEDASIRTAAKNGGITKISTVDVKQTNVLGLFWKFETIVTGE